MDLVCCLWAFSFACFCIILLIMFYYPLHGIIDSLVWKYSKKKKNKRRNELHDRLLELRRLVPRISSLDKASILVDAIQFVKDLQKQVKELSDVLQRNSDLQQLVLKFEQINEDTSGNHTQQIIQEAEVEVSVIDENELCVKVLCEQSPCMFVRMMEAFDTLCLQITHANVTTHHQQRLVSHIYTVKMKKENEMVVAEDVRDSLLQAIRISK